MINVRAEFRVNAKRVYLSGPIRNPVALAALHGHFATAGRPAHLRVHDDEEHALIADLCLRQARLRGRVVELTWGDRSQYRVEFARMPKAAGTLRVVGGFPLLDARPPDPLPPAISEYDVHGPGIVASARPRPPAPPTWLDRLLTWLLGSRQPEQRVPQKKVLDA